MEGIEVMTEVSTTPFVGNASDFSTGNLVASWFKGPVPIRISVVIPTLNEEENLPFVLPGVMEWADEVVLVDGYSTDRTVEVARELCPEVCVVMQGGRGKGNALITGFAATTGDIIVMLDADGSTSPAEIPAYIGALLAGAHFAKGSRFLQGGGTADMPFYRKVGNWSFVVIVRLLFGGSYTDLCYGYNAFWKRVLPLLGLDGEGFEIETMMNIRALKAGLRVVEVPSFEAERVYGISRLRTIPDGWRVLKTIFKERLTSGKRVPKETSDFWRRRVENRLSFKASSIPGQPPNTAQD
jgi:glycosyltransferase involved in cell wall biosynthesis